MQRPGAFFDCPAVMPAHRGHLIQVKATMAQVLILRRLGRPVMAEKPKLSEMLSSFVIVWAIRLIVALFALTFLCGVIVIILRYVFRIEIWNPFHQIS
jgi:hypothetical protein